MLRDPACLGFVLIYGLIQMSMYGAIFYLPAEVSALMHKPAGLEVGLVSAIPWICALCAVYWLPKAADRWNNHRQLAALTLFIAGCASFAFPTAGPRMGLAMLSIAVSGFIAVQPLFWTFPTGYLADRAKAGGIALIGSGNLGGFMAPNLKVWADQYFHSPSAGLYVLAGITVLNAGLIALTMKRGPGQCRLKSGERYNRSYGGWLHKRIDPKLKLRRETAAKLGALEARLRQLGRLMVAYSGGVDSAFLAGTAHRVLGDRMLAVLADSASLARRDMEQACAFAQSLGMPLKVIETEELDKPEYARNDANRCFHCKDELFAAMKALGGKLGFSSIAYGMNADDTRDYRPGQRAAKQHEVLAPLAEAG